MFRIRQLPDWTTDTDEHSTATYSRNFLVFEDVPLVKQAQMWLQHYRAPPYNHKREDLNKNYEGKWIGRNRPMTWPTWSCNLNPLSLSVGLHEGNDCFTVVNHKKDLS